MQPIIVDLGKKKRKDTKKLEKGRGKLYQQALEAVEQVRAGLGADANGKELLPIVVTFSKKQKRKKRGLAFAPPF